MIESCTKRRMVISVVALGILTLLLLVLEEALTSGPVNQSPTPYSANQSVEKAVFHRDSPVTVKQALSASEKAALNSKGSCWQTETFEVLEECGPCTAFEISSQTPIVCIETGLKEKLQCNTSGLTFRSCHSVKSIEKRNFLIFSFSMLLLFVLSFGTSKFRTSQLERQMIKNIEKRLASGH